MANLRVLMSLSVAAAMVLQMSPSACVQAASKKDKPKPAGTVLLPLTPKIDDGSTPPSAAPKPTAAASAASASSASTATNSSGDSAPDAQATAAGTSSNAPHNVKVDPIQPIAPSAVAAQPNISAEVGNDETAGDPGIDQNTLLKGTVQIVADDTEYDQEKNTFLGTGNAVALIAGQDSKLQADTILYDQNNGTIDARGNVKILRSGQLTTGSSFKFHINSDEYLITDPDTELQGTTVIARTAKGNGRNLVFKNGDFSLPQPIHIMNNAFYGPLSSSEHAMDVMAHPNGYVPQKQSYKFTARKMIYERYKDEGNLTVFGGNLKFDNFTVPIGRFTANVGTENTRVVFPILPVIGNNMMVGGTNIGPQFNYAVGKTGAFSWAPLLQYGGVTSGGASNNGKLGAGFKIGYSTDKFSAHLGYGSVSNILVGDLKYRFTKNTQFQSGINRFLNEGMFGMRRARLLAEVVDNHGLAKIPYVSYLNFRTSGGWAEDNPSLVNLQGSQYSQLFKPTNKGKVSAYRLQEQVTLVSHPIFSVGNSAYGADLLFAAGAAARLYSTGDHMLLAQAGPMINTRAGRFRGRFGYTQTGVRGQSPFVFDQFIQGQQSVYFQGDIKVTKWLSLGTNLGYNMNSKLMYSRAITAAVGPDDFKVLFMRDTISGYQRFGFDVLYGSPIGFNKLLVKNAPDAGQTGGI
ncbi:MAG TPA: hypothetical protein V6D22_14575 [Candidatus Obscuribacterales bacterium]